jgi:hypothetical protein
VALSSRRAGHGDGQLGRLAVGQTVQHSRDFSRDAGTHEHIVDACEHRPERGGRCRELDLLQVVHAHRPVMAQLGQVHLDEVARHDQLVASGVWAQPEPRGRPERDAGGQAARHEVPAQDPLGNSRQGKAGQRFAHVSVRVTPLQAPRQDRVQRYPGHHTQLPGRRHGSGQPPAGHTNAHPALDDHRWKATRPIRMGNTAHT